MSSDVISVSDLSFAYDKNLILDNVNFSVKEGDFVAIVGENGAGKSTLMNLILHNLNNYDGEIKLFGTDIKEDNHFRDLAYISQNSVLSYRNFPTTIEEAVKIHLSFLKTNCQIKCNTYGKKPKSSSLGVLYCIHFLGLLFIKLKLSFKSLIFTSDKSIPLG